MTLYKQQKLLESYDHLTTLLVISTYPDKGEVYSRGKSGVASYIKNSIRLMDRKVIVLADYTTKPSIYEEGNTLVIRCFKNGTMGMYKELFSVIQKLSAVQKILVQYDFSLYGSMITNGLMIPFLYFLKKKGYHIAVTLHHVVTDIRKLSGHVGLGTTPIDTGKAWLYNFIFRLFYIGLDTATNQIITLETPLKEKLSRFINPCKIVSIPHGVDTTIQPINKEEARKKLGLPQQTYIILFFGYVNWFKGADLFAQFFHTVTKLLGKRVLCIMAGGESATLKNHAYYQAYYKKTASYISRSSSMQLTGYVPQQKIPLYFSASDVVVMPYRHFMTASGVLSLIFSYRKPFIVSRELSEFFKSPDMAQACQEVGLNYIDVSFDLTKQSCLTVTKNVLRNGLKQKMIDMAGIISKNRAYALIATRYEETLFSPSYKLTTAPYLGYTS